MEESAITIDLLTEIRDSMKSLAESLETQTTLELWDAPWLTPELASKILPMTAEGIKEAARLATRSKHPARSKRSVRRNREEWTKS